MFKNALFLLSVTLMIFSCGRKTSMELGDSGLVEIMKKDVMVLADDKMAGREAGTVGEKMAAAYIKERMEKIGLKPGFENSFYQDFDRRIRSNPHATTDSPDDKVVNVRNVAGMVDNGKKGWVVIGAHYDHLGYGQEGSLHTGDPMIHNGADDNASGVGILLSLADQLQNNDITEEHNIIFIGFSGEEKGLWGSNYYVKNAQYNMEDVSYMFNMDMVGRLNSENKLAVNGTGTSPIFEKVLNDKNTMGFSLVFSASGVGPSDHTSFYLENVPVLHFFTGQHPDYHRPSDDPNLLNYDGMGKIYKYLYDMIMELDKTPDLAFVKTKDESQEAPRFKVTLGVIPDYLFDGKGMRIDGVKEGRPAQIAGIQKGDVVTKMGDVEIVDMMSYMKGLSSYNKGDQVTVIIERDGKQISKTVTF